VVYFQPIFTPLGAPFFNPPKWHVRHDSYQFLARLVLLGLQLKSRLSTHSFCLRSVSSTMLYLWRLFIISADFDFATFFAAKIVTKAPFAYGTLRLRQYSHFTLCVSFKLTFELIFASFVQVFIWLTVGVSCANVIPRDLGTRTHMSLSTFPWFLVAAE
jgi:hypothetical protein